MNDDKQNTHQISVLVTDKPGVLGRVANVFARRGFNIDSLVVSPSALKGQSRMTIVCIGAEEGIEQIVKQVAKLVDVVRVDDHREPDLISREMVLVKVACQKSQRLALLELARFFRAKPVDIHEESIVFEATGNTEKLDAFERMMEEYGIIEKMRTGRLILMRGPEPT